MQEIKTLVSCHSENIVKYNGAFFNEGFVNIVLEYMDLGSLESILKKSK